MGMAGCLVTEQRDEEVADSGSGCQEPSGSSQK